MIRQLSQLDDFCRRIGKQGGHILAFSMVFVGLSLNALNINVSINMGLNFADMSAFNLICYFLVFLVLPILLMCGIVSQMAKSRSLMTQVCLWVYTLFFIVSAVLGFQRNDLSTVTVLSTLEAAYCVTLICYTHDWGDHHESICFILITLIVIVGLIDAIAGGGGRIDYSIYHSMTIISDFLILISLWAGASFVREL